MSTTPGAKIKTTSYHRDEAGDFAFDADNRALAERIIARYPEGRQNSAVIALLDLAQRQNGGWLSKAAIEHVATVLDMAPIRVHEVVSFYTMFYDKPVGQHLVQVCRTTPCWLRGSDELTGACLKKAGTRLGETSADGKFTVIEVECLGACANAPMVQINDDYYEDLTAESMTQILDDLAAGKTVQPGPHSGRKGSAPEGGPATLLEVPPPIPFTPPAEPAKAEGEAKGEAKGEGGGA